MATIGFIGVGELALYTIRGIRRGGYLGKILLSPRNQVKAKYLAQNYDCQVQNDNQSVVSNCDYVFIATRPADCIETLSALEFKARQVLVSVVAGVEIETLRSAVDPQIDIVRAMPVSSAEASASPTLIYPANPFVEALFDKCGQSIAVENELVFEQGSVLACVYSWFFALYEELIQATKGPSLPPELAAKLVMGMAAGAAELALVKTEQSPGQIASSIATEGTFSKMGLDLLRQEQAFEPWQQACELLKRQLAGDA